jgi:hypothetical protein
VRFPRIPRRWLVPSLLLLAVAAVGLGLRAADPPKPAPAPPAAQPSLVTLTMDATLDQVLDELQKQTDIAVDRSRADSSRPVKIDVKQVPFWEALEKIAKSADHRIAFAEQGRSIMLVTGENVTYREVPLSIDGVFRLAGRRVQATYDLDQGRTLYEVQLALHWEPKYSAFLVEVPGKTVTARDNTGKELPVGEGRGRMAVSGGGTNLTLRLNDVPRSARTIQLLEGRFSVVGAAKMLRFEFTKVGLEEQARTIDGVTVKVKADFKEGADLWKARVDLEYPEGGPQLESFEAGAWLSENSAFLVSADNKRRMDVNGGSDYETPNARRAVVNYHWVPPDDGKFGKPSDWRLVIQTPSQLAEVPVKFKLENIPLP